MQSLQDIYQREYANFPARRESLLQQFRMKYGAAPVRWFSSSGRAEIVGNHTDHNLGKVIVSAISCDILCAASPRDEDIVEISSEKYRPIRIHLSDLAPREGERGSSIALVRGVLAFLVKEHPVGGFSAVTSSSIFRGAGVSSSAAFSVLVAEIVNTLFCDGNLTPVEKAKAAQYAENVYFGKPCGLLDQCGVALGGLNKIDFGGAEPEFHSLPAPKGYTLVLTNTGGSHAGLTSHYAAIKKEMGEVAAFFGKRYLREVEPQQLWENLPELRKKAKERAILRATHFFEENDRVDRAARALETGDVSAFFDQVQASGESSLAFLQNCYVPGSTSQPLVLALKLSEKLLKGGAFRMMGGGFTGTVLAFCPEEDAEEYRQGMARVYGKENVFLADFRPVGATELEI